LPKSANRGIAHHLSYFLQQGEILFDRACGLPAHETVQEFLLTHSTHATGDALPAGFVSEKGCHPQQNIFQIDLVVEEHDHA
jgi:hypothetical protein